MSQWRKTNIDVQGEWEIQPSHLAALYKHMKWGIDGKDGKYVFPDESQIKDIIGTMIEDLWEEGPKGIGKLKQRSRLLVYRDPEAPGSFDVFLNVGYAWAPSLMSEEEKKMLEGDES